MATMHMDSIHNPHVHPRLKIVNVSTSTIKKIFDRTFLSTITGICRLADVSVIVQDGVQYCPNHFACHLGCSLGVAPCIYIKCIGTICMVELHK